jgi:methylated-DNA-[protein]-cysteine S-methyltransferase
MSQKPATCARIQDDLVATAMGEAAPDVAGNVDRHLAICSACRHEFAAYSSVNDAVAALREAPASRDASRAREQLRSRLAELKQRLLAYRIYASPLGRILVARSETGIAAIEYLEHGAAVGQSHLGRQSGIELVEGGPELDDAYRDLTAYLEGRTHRLEWPLDLRFARSDFQRAVLQATAAIPYGAVVPYSGLAREIGRAPAVRAVAQALRWNPLPIVIPCHRVIGMSGALTGYAGNKVDRKQQLLTLEGVPVADRAGVLRISADAMYLLTPGDREYCIPTCPSVLQHPDTPFTRFASRECAEAAGFAPCTACRPDLHPIPR